MVIEAARTGLLTEFERTIHKTSEQGEPLTGSKFSDAYLALLQKYHGQTEGVMDIDPLYAIEWAYVPHFYLDFYVYQYATSMSGAVWFANQILEGNTGCVCADGGPDGPNREIARPAGMASNPDI